MVAGTTGESPTLTDDEKLTLWEAVADAVTIPVIAGSGTNDTAHSVHLTAEASKLGVAGILALCPYYNRPSQAGIEGHLRAVAEATDLPVIIYDIPVRTGPQDLDRRCWPAWPTRSTTSSASRTPPATRPRRPG